MPPRQCGALRRRLALPKLERRGLGTLLLSPPVQPNAQKGRASATGDENSPVMFACQIFGNAAGKHGSVAIAQIRVSNSAPLGPSKQAPVGQPLISARGRQDMLCLFSATAAVSSFGHRPGSPPLLTISTPTAPAVARNPAAAPNAILLRPWLLGFRNGCST